MSLWNHPFPLSQFEICQPSLFLSGKQIHYPHVFKSLMHSLQVSSFLFPDLIPSLHFIMTTSPLSYHPRPGLNMFKYLKYCTKYYYY